MTYDEAAKKMIETTAAHRRGRAKTVQTKHITDSVFLDAMRRAIADNNVRYGWSDYTVAFLDQVCKLLAGFPEKIVQRKAESLIKRGVIEGCACGCRGDFKPKEPFGPLRTAARS